MKSIKKLLLGISILLFGIAIISSDMGSPFLYAGFGFTIVGLIISINGYLSNNDKSK